MKTVGLVLSGGGARGIAHLGVLKALDELGVKVSAISGSSAGAIIGALYAAGLTPTSILAEVDRLYDFHFSDLDWLKNRVFALGGIRKSLQRLLANISFPDLQTQLFVTATDVVQARSITFSEGDLLEIVLASSSIPAVAHPVKYREYQLFDGGILNNLPVEPLKGRYDIIIGSYVNKITNGITSLPSSKLMLLDQCFHLAITDLIKPRAAACDVYIDPPLHGFSLFDLKNAHKLFDLGYTETMKHKEKLNELLA